MGLSIVLSALSALASAIRAQPILSQVAPGEPSIGRFKDAIETIRRAGANSEGGDAARHASELLADAGAPFLPELLAAMDTTNPLAANWLRHSFETIVARELERGSDGIPAGKIEEFLRDRERAGRPRRLALNLLRRIDPTVEKRLIEGWLDDPEFRRDAIADLMRKGDHARSLQQLDQAREAFERCFQHARHSDQVLASVDRLRAMSIDVDPVSHLGFAPRWWIVGPFPAPGTTGFNLPFPPQDGFDEQASYRLDDGTILRWNLHQSADRLGEVNLNQVLGPTTESIAYAYTEIECAGPHAARLACSADDNLTVWLNDKVVLAREQWLNGTRLDRFVVPVSLAQGLNRIRVKICQGPQHVNPEVPNNWTFQIRFCDASGLGIEFVNRLPAPDQGAK